VSYKGVARSSVTIKVERQAEFEKVEKAAIMSMRQLRYPFTALS